MVVGASREGQNINGMKGEGITGKEGIIGTSADAAEQHKIKAYEERIEQNVRATIVAEGVLRKNSNTPET